MSVVDELRTIDLFDGLSDEQLAAWAAVTEPRDVPEGELLLEQGVESPGPLLLFEGTAVPRQGNDPLEPNHAPTWIGAIAAITESAVPVDVRARSIKRVASAVGEGSMAVSLIHEYLAE